MKKVLKIAARIFLGVLLIVFLALIIVPVIFKAPILTRVENELNSSLNAEVSFDDFRLSLIKKFSKLKYGAERPFYCWC